MERLLRIIDFEVFRVDLKRRCCDRAGHALRASSWPRWSDAWHMIRRRAKAAGIDAPIGNHTVRATGITAYLANSGALEHAQEMAAHESPRTTKFCDRTRERLSHNEVERIRF